MALSLRRMGGRSNYPYAVARVQAKRAKLVPRSEYEKMLRMDVAEITRFVEESTYKTEVDELSTKFTGLDLLEAALSVNQERTNAEVRRMLGGEGGTLIALFLDRYRFDALKTLLRGKASGAKRDELLREMVIESQDDLDLFSPLLADEVKSLPDVLAALEKGTGAARDWSGILQKVPAGATLPRYEDALDKAYYARLLAVLEASKETGASDMLEFIRREIDARNLLNAARWVAAGEQGDFSPFVIPGGRHLKVADVMALARSKDLAALADQLGEHKAFASVKDALAAAATSRRLGAFQAAVWRAHLEDLDKLAHSHPLSLVPILLFLIRKHREVATIRAIARGKAAGLSEARLQELVI